MLVCSPSSTMSPPLPHSKIILYSPFLHEQYSMAIHTELLKTAISSSTLYFSTLVINIAFSYLCPCAIVISIFFVLQFPAIFNILAVSLPLLCLAVFLPLILLYVRRLLFQRSQPPTSNDASVIFPPHTAPPSPIPSSSSTLLSSPQPSATLGNLRFKTTVNGYGWMSTRGLGWAFLRVHKSYGMVFCLPSWLTTVSFDSFSRRSQRSTTCDFKGENFVCFVCFNFCFFSIYFLSLPVSFVCFLKKWHWFPFFAFYFQSLRSGAGKAWISTVEVRE